MTLFTRFIFFTLVNEKIIPFIFKQSATHLCVHVGTGYNRQEYPITYQYPWTGRHTQVGTGYLQQIVDIGSKQ